MYSVSRFDIDQKDFHKIAEEMRLKKLKEACLACRSKLTAQKVDGEIIKQQELEIQNGFEERKDADIKSHLEELLQFKPLNPLPACKEDAKKMLDFCITYLNVPIRNITLMCSPEDFSFITRRPLWDM